MTTKRENRWFWIIWLVLLAYYLIRWKTLLFGFSSFLALTACVLMLIYWMLNATLGKLDILKRSNIIVFCTTLFFTFFLSESSMRFVLKNQLTYHESSSSNKGFFSSYFQWNTNKHLTYYPGSTIKDLQFEFDYERKVNSLGFLGVDPSEKDSSKLRIACFGDSFTQGVGSPVESTWPASLGYHLNEIGISNEIINAGLQASDPIYNVSFFKEVIWPEYEPDVVVFAFNNTDIHDIIIRGGNKRFKEDGSVEYRKAPWWEFIYATSHTARLVVHGMGYDGYLIHSSKFESFRQEAKMEIEKAYRDAILFLKNKDPNVRVIVLKHPLRDAFEMNFNREYGFEAYNFSDVNYSFDLAPLMLDKMLEEQKKYSDWYWDLDRHHNSEGYWAFGELVASEISPLFYVKPQDTATINF